MLKTICVQCGSSLGMLPCYAEAAHQLGRYLAEENITLVYGGSNIGIMGVMARAAMEKGGRVIGVIPEHIRSKVEMLEVTELHVVETMHERKRRMADLSDGFIAMPGGFGTLDEFFEVITWSQLDLHTKPCGLLNVNGYYDGLLSFLDNAVDAGFIQRVHRMRLLVDSDPEALMRLLFPGMAANIRKTTPAKQTHKPH